MNKFDSRLVAKYIIYRAKESSVEMNITKSHKYLYILDGVLLGKSSGHIDIIDENCRVWKYGPVYPKVHKFLHKNPIETLGEYEELFDTLEKIEYVKEFTQMILDDLGDYFACDLSEWSCKKDSPWDVTRRNEGKEGGVIPKRIIQEYFKEQFFSDSI